MLLCYPVKTPPTRVRRAGLKTHERCRRDRVLTQRLLLCRQPKEKVSLQSPLWLTVATAVLGKSEEHQDTRAARLTLLGREWTLERPLSGSHPPGKQR